MQLIVNKQELNLTSDTQLNIIYSVLDIQDYATRTTTFSKDFELPSTPINDEFFETLYQLDKSYSKFNPKIKAEALITDGGQTIIKGYLQLIDINKNNDGTFYNVQIVGELVNLIDALKDLSLRDLDLSEYDHIRNLTNVKNSWSYNIVKNGTTITSKEGYVYPDIIYNDETNLVEHKYLYNMFPAVYVKTLIDKIFEKANYEYKSSFLTSDYFSKLILPFTLDKLPIPQEELDKRTGIRGVIVEGTDDNFSIPMTGVRLIGEPWIYNISQDYSLKAGVIGGTAFNDNSNTVNNSGTEITFNDPEDLIVTDKFTAQEEGLYAVNIDTKCFPRYTLQGTDFANWNGNGSIFYRWHIMVRRADGTREVIRRNADATNDNPYHVEQTWPSPAAELSFPGPIYNDIEADGLGLSPKYVGNVFLSAGDQIIVQFGFRHTLEFNTPTGTGFIFVQIRMARSLDNQISKFEVKPYNEQTYGNEQINLSTTLPNISISGFMQSIVQMFNLIIEPDEDDPNLLHIEPYSDYYANGKIIDWTEKLENEDDLNIILTPDIKNINLSYTDDKDWLNEKYTDDTKKIWGQYEFWTGNQFSDEVQELNLIFAPTPSTNLGTRVVPYLATKDESGVIQKTNTKPRILFYDGLKEGTPFTFGLNENVINTGTVETHYPYCGMWDDPYKPRNTLEFFPSLQMYYDVFDNTDPDLPLYNLFNKFHQFSLKNLVDKDYRRIEGTFYLTSKDINELNLNDKVKLDNQLYRILEVEYISGIEDELLSRAVLEKLVDFNFYQPVESVGLNVCPIDVRTTFRPLLGTILTSSTGNINEECCGAMGGTLLPNGVCQIRPGVVYDAFPEINIYKPGGTVTRFGGPYIIGNVKPSPVVPISIGGIPTLTGVLGTVRRINDWVNSMQNDIESGLSPSGTGTTFTLPIWINDDQTGDTLGSSIISQISNNTIVQIGGGIKIDTINNDDTLTKILATDNDGNVSWRDVSSITPIPSDNVTGSGTTNYVSKWTGTHTQGDSQIFDNGTNVGIGNDTPTEKLTVDGNVRINSSANRSLQVNMNLSSAFSSSRIMSFYLNNTEKFGIWARGSGTDFNRLGINSESFGGDIITFQDNGNVGINQIAPTAQLDVNSSSALSTHFVSKIGNLNVKGDGNVGIGTTTPNSKLHLSFNSNDRIALWRNSTALNDFTEVGLGVTTNQVDSNIGASLRFTRTNTPTVADGRLGIFTREGASFTEKFSVLSDGNVGINTTTPTETLHVNGNILLQSTANRFKLSTFSEIFPYSSSPFRGTFYQSAGTSGGWRGSHRFRVGFNGTNIRDALFIGANANTTTSNIGINQIAPTAQLHIQADSALTTRSMLQIRDVTDTFDILTVNGRGDILTGRGQSGSVFLGSAIATGTYNGSFNIGIGQSILQNVDGNLNIGIGNGIMTNTVGGGNIGIGYRPMLNTTIGSNNVVLGFEALENGGNNTANVIIGRRASRSIGDGSNNVAIGQSAGTGAVGGNQNVFIGDNANSASAFASGTQNSVIIGRSARVQDVDQTNQIVIGHSALGNGSNTVTLGANTITNTFLKGVINLNNVGSTTATTILAVDTNGNIVDGSALAGGGISGSGTLNYLPKFTPDGSTLGDSQIFDDATNVGIGIVTPTQKLDVNGKGRIRTIDNGQGDFLTNDADGVITKRTPTETRQDLNAIQNSTTYDLYLGPVQGSETTHYMQPSGWNTLVTYTATADANTSGRFRCYHGGIIDGFSINWRYTSSGADRTVTYVMHNLTQNTSKTIGIIQTDLPGGTVGSQTRVLNFDFSVNAGDFLQIRAISSTQIPSNHFSCIVFSINEK